MNHEQTLRATYCTVDEAADHLEAHRSQVSRWLTAGRLEGVRWGRDWLVVREGLKRPADLRRAG